MIILLFGLACGLAPADGDADETSGGTDATEATDATETTDSTPGTDATEVTEVDPTDTEAYCVYAFPGCGANPCPTRQELMDQMEPSEYYDYSCPNGNLVVYMPEAIVSPEGPGHMTVVHDALGVRVGVAAGTDEGICPSWDDMQWGGVTALQADCPGPQGDTNP